LTKQKEEADDSVTYSLAKFDDNRDILPTETSIELFEGFNNNLPSILKDCNPLKNLNFMTKCMRTQDRDTLIEL
jgi:hypothetical protein